MSYMAEQCVIGSLLMDPECMDKVYGILSEEMFTSQVLGRAYREYQKGYDNRYGVTFTVLVQNLSADFPADMVTDVLVGCSNETATSTMIAAHARVVVNDYKARKTRILLNDIQLRADCIDDQIGELIHALEDIKGSNDDNMRTLPDIVTEYSGRYFCERADDGIQFGFPCLDDIVGTMDGGDLVVIGARPAVGKSAFVTTLAHRLALEGKRVGFFNLEMQDKQMYERFAVLQSGISLTRLRRAEKPLGDEGERFRLANQALSGLNNLYIFTGPQRTSGIRTKSRHMGFDVIIVDYLQLIKGEGTYRGNRYAEVGEISHELKLLAMELNIPVIALSQLNRTADEFKEPDMAALREAGDIEQDASLIIEMWTKSKKQRNIKCCKVEKQRQGRTGAVQFRFQGDVMKFTELTEKETEWRDIPEDDDCPFK